MSGQPSITSDYARVIVRAIESAKNDPEHLRSLVYEIARSSLSRHILTNYHEFGGGKWYRLMMDLEDAINHIESLSQTTGEALTDQPIAPSLAADSRNALLVRDPIASAIVNNPQDANANMVSRLTSSEVYNANHQAPEILQPSEIWPSIATPRRQRSRIDVSWGGQLAIAAFIGVVIYAVFLGPFGNNDALTHLAPQQAADGMATSPAAGPQPGTKASLRETNSASAAQALGFSPPTAYGVYAVSDRKLFALDPLPIKVPDPRVGVSAMFSEPSHVDVPNGKLTFVIYRRDLAASAPTEAFVRVVAQVQREARFGGAGPPTVEKIDGQWAIRSKSYGLKVAPVDDNPEMIVMRPDSPDLVLPAGRYALATPGRGYDFTVAGQMTDTAHCLERTNVVGGTVYSECRELP